MTRPGTEAFEAVCARSWAVFDARGDCPWARVVVSAPDIARSHRSCVVNVIMAIEEAGAGASLEGLLLQAEIALAPAEPPTEGSVPP